MSVRPNIQSLTLGGATGTDLLVQGESEDDPTLAGIFVVVSQDGAAGAARLSRPGIVNRAGAGWSATIKNTTFHKGAAEAMGVQVHVDPFQSTSWVQSVFIT
jgi:hypothetical protein